MTRKPNFAKFIVGTAVLALLFVGTWAATSARLASANKSAVSTAKSALAVPKMMPGLSAPLSPAGTDLVTASIELDGDVVETAGLPDDWATINCDGGTAVAKTGVILDGSNKTIFTGGGSKDNIDINPPGWQWKNGSTPPKDDLINGYAAKFVGATGDTILAFGAERSSNNGTAFIGVWFFQNEVSLDADGTFNGVHSIGDILVLNTFTQGGSFATAKVYEWVGAGGTCAAGDILQKGGNLCDITGSAPAGSVLSVSNGSPITIPPGSCPGWAYPGGTVPTNAFFEGAINLDAFPALAGACFSSFLIETRSSSVVDAVLKDFILGQFDTCPNPSITKTADSNSVCEGTATVYTYTVTNPAGTDSVDVTLSDDAAGGTAFDPAGVTCIETTNGGTGAGPGSPITVAGGATRTFQCTRTLSVGEHKNTVTMTWNNGADSATADATVTVLAIPDARISVLVCSDGSTILTGSDANNTGGTFAWSGAGSGTSTTTAITGVGNYTLTISNGTCTDSATRTIGLCSDSDDAP